jgi:transposase
VTTPDEATVWVGLDISKDEHFLGDASEPVFARAVSNDEADLEALLDRATGHGEPGLVIDQPGSIAQLAIAVAARRGVRVA